MRTSATCSRIWPSADLTDHRRPPRPDLRHHHRAGGGRLRRLRRRRSTTAGSSGATSTSTSGRRTGPSSGPARPTTPGRRRHPRRPSAPTAGRRSTSTWPGPASTARRRSARAPTTGCWPGSPRCRPTTDGRRAGPSTWRAGRRAEQAGRLAGRSPGWARGAGLARKRGGAVLAVRGTPARGPARDGFWYLLQPIAGFGTTIAGSLRAEPAPGRPPVRDA